MAKLYSCLAVMVASTVRCMVYVTTVVALAGDISGAPRAEAATLQDMKTGCRPQSFVLPAASLPRSAAAVRNKSPFRILAIGSSSTQGIGASDPQFTYPARLKIELNSLKTMENVDVRNSGIGGETIDQTLKRLTSEIDSYKPDLVLWQVGTNDAVTGSDPAAFRKMIDAGAKAITARGIDAILIDPQFYLKIREPVRYESYVNIIHAVAQDNHMAVFPRFKLMEAWDSREGGVAAMLGPDGFHMGDRGYICMASLLSEQISGAIEKSTAKLARP